MINDNKTNTVVGAVSVGALGVGSSVGTLVLASGGTSGAAMMSGLATLGGLVGGGALTGIGVIAAIPLAVIGICYGIGCAAAKKEGGKN